MALFDPIIGKLQSALAARNLRHEVVSSNLANADTPGYRAKRADFDDALASMMSPEQAGTLRTTAGGHLSGAEPGSIDRVVETEDTPASPDGNTVSRETEITAMAENQLLYRASTKAVARQLALVRYAISEGGR